MENADFFVRTSGLLYLETDILLLENGIEKWSRVKKEAIGHD